MVHLLRDDKTLEGSVPRRLFSSDAEKILVFERHRLVFLFNFHSNRSVTDFPVLVPPAHGYRLVLSSDDSAFGGQDRIKPGQDYLVAPEIRGNEECTVIRIYLPCRTAIVLKPDDEA